MTKRRRPHSHPAHRNPADEVVDHPDMTESAKARSDRWMCELDADDRDMLAKQTYIGKLFMGTD